jgi:hypothetical protein
MFVKEACRRYGFKNEGVKWDYIYRSLFVLSFLPDVVTECISVEYRTRTGTYCRPFVFLAHFDARPFFPLS